MEFETDGQRTAYERCVGLAREVFGETITLAEDRPAFLLGSGSAFVAATVHPWRDGGVLRALAWVVTDVEYTAELGQYLLRANDGLVFGSFGMDKEGDIFFQQTVVAHTIDKEEFKSTLLAVAQTADEEDDEIVKRFGGRRAVDRVRD